MIVLVIFRRAYFNLTHFVEEGYDNIISIKI